MTSFGQCGADVISMAGATREGGHGTNPGQSINENSGVLRITERVSNSGPYAMRKSSRSNWGYLLDLAAVLMRDLGCYLFQIILGLR